jgi:site-specific recombinase XerD
MAERGLLARFEEHLASSGMASATIVNYLADIRSFSSWFCDVQSNGGFPSLVGAEHVRHYCRALYQDGRSVSTINRRLQALRKFYDFVGQTDLAMRNPARDVERLDEPSAVSPRVLSTDEIRQLLSAVDQGTDALACRDRAIMLLLIETGLKVSELVDLRVGDLMFDADARVHDTGAGVCGRVLVGQKHRSLGRWLALDAEISVALQAWMQAYSHVWVLEGRGNNDQPGKRSRDERPANIGPPVTGHLFVNRQGQVLSVRSVQRLVSHYARVAGLEGVSTQTLRYTFARRAFLERNGDLSEVARMLGLRDVAGVRRYLERVP